MTQLIDILLHLDRHLGALSSSLGLWMYALLFLIIFCETGLVVLPFLPGDSLLFAVGALCAIEESGLNLWLMMALLLIAAVVGDGVNYAVGKYVGPAVFKRDDSVLLNKAHLVRAQKFYEKHGSKAIVLARFVPIVRTFAPFVAGIGKMNYGKFAFYNVAGAVFWVVGFLGLGYQFGNMPIVKKQFHYVILGIIVISVIPVVLEYFKARSEARSEALKS